MSNVLAKPHLISGQFFIFNMSGKSLLKKGIKVKRINKYVCISKFRIWIDEDTINKVKM